MFDGYTEQDTGSNYRLAAVMVPPARLTAWFHLKCETVQVFYACAVFLFF
jgi:hypothetical protein